MAFLLNHVRRLLHFNCKILSSKANYGSALYITGDKGVDVCPVVTPYTDFEDRLADLDSLKENIKRRNLSIDVDKIKNVWDFLLKLRQNYQNLDEQNQTLLKKVRDLYSQNEKASHNEAEKFKMHLKVVRQDMKNLKTVLWSIEEKAMIQALAFPNSLHPSTPSSDGTEIFHFKDKPAVMEARNHLEIATEADLLKFTSPHSYYLKKDAAIFELCGKFFFSKCLRDAGFVQFSNPDFTKSAIVEACGLNHTDPDKVYILHHNETTKLSEDNRLHLTGGGSLLAFAAYHTRNIVFPTAFPLRYFGFGRQYKPVPITSKLGLFQVSQSSVVQLFIAVKDSTEDLNAELDKATILVSDIYKKFNYHFKVCYIPATQLECWESLRISFQMFSPFLNTYIEVGNLSVSDDYISKRVHFSYKEDRKKFPKLISGTVLSVPKLLGCILEQNPDQLFEIPPVIKNTL